MRESTTEDRDRTIIRVIHNRDNPYVQIHRAIFEDNRLSWKAKGLMGYLLSRPDDWEIRIGDLVRRSTDGRTAVYTGLRELRRVGYVDERITRHPTLGFITDREYVVYEARMGNDPVSSLAGGSAGRDSLEDPQTHVAELDSGFLDQANPPLQIKDPDQLLTDNNIAPSDRIPVGPGGIVVVGHDPVRERGQGVGADGQDQNPPDPELLAFLTDICLLVPDLARELVTRYPDRVRRVRAYLTAMPPAERKRKFRNLAGFVRRAIAEDWRFEGEDAGAAAARAAAPLNWHGYRCGACGYETVAAGDEPPSACTCCGCADMVLDPNLIAPPDTQAGAL